MKTRAWFVGLCCGLMLAGCAPASAPTRSDGSSPQTPAAPKTLRLVMQAAGEPTDGIIVFAGSGSRAVEQYLAFHAGLTVYDPRGEILPRLAQKVPTVDDGDWRVQPDGSMEVTWKLRPDARWHDGAQLTADDFVLGWQVITDAALPLRRPASSNFISEARAADPQTLVVSWKQPYMLANFASPEDLPALPRHLIGDMHARGDPQSFTNSLYWTREFVGLGPYRIGSWELGSHIEALAFDQYLLGRPKIDRVVIQYIGDVNAIVASLLAGDADMVPATGGLDPPQMVPVKTAWDQSGAGTTMAIPRGIRNIHLQRRDPSAPWARDLRVRQALVHMLDRNDLMETLQSGIGAPAHTFVTLEEPAYALLEQRGLAKYQFDRAQADRLMVEAGITRGTDGIYQVGGQRLTMDVAVTGRGDNPKEAEAVSGLWSAAGIAARPSIIPPNATNLDELKNTYQGAFIWPWNISPDISQQLTSGDTPNVGNRWKGGNYGAYASPTYDRLYEQYATTLDANRRNGAYADLMKVLADEIGSIPMYYTTSPLMFRKAVRGPGMVPPIQPGNSWNMHEWEMV
jgi:peptide/nickel transport system substrate-binding protein